MTHSWHKAPSTIFLTLALTCPALAFEAAPSTSATAILGAQVDGPNYRVEPTVRSDGLLYLFTLKTAFGPFEIAGNDLMHLRIRELAALRKLQAMSESDVFLKSFGQAATAPLRYGSDLLTDPSATLEKTISGVSNMFDRIGSGLSNGRASRDNVVNSVLGVDTARRTLAIKLGVDPYTDFPPLSSKLNDIASSAALGGLSIKALELAIPGGAGIAVSSVSTADTARGTLAEKSSTQVIQAVLGRLGQMLVPGSVANHLVQNRAYTPTDLLVMANALSSLGAGNTLLFVARAADAPTREEAFFQRRRAELLAKHAKALGIGSFVDVAGFPLNRLKDGRLIALFPFDDVAWTRRVASSFEAVASATSAERSPLVLAFPGALTPMAQTEVARLGWTVQKLR